MIFSSLQKSIQKLWISFPQTSALRIVLGFCILSIASQISIPFYPVPFTMQPLAVLGLALFFPASEAFLTVFSWITAGTLGLPVFASFHAGPGVILGTTGGYIMGFLAATGVIGILKKYFDLNKPLSVFFALFIGCAVIYLMGFAYLSFLIQSKQKAFEFGVAPFWAPDLLKILALTALHKKIKTMK